MYTPTYIQGFVPLVMTLVGLGIGIHFMQEAKGHKLAELTQRKRISESMAQSIQRLDREIKEQSSSLSQVEDFYRAWLPHIQRCQDSDALIAEILVEAYRLDLVPMSKEVKNDQKVTFRGRKGQLDQIDLSVSGRYDRLVRFVNGLRKSYPFLRIERIAFSEIEGTLQLSMVLSACKLVPPDAELDEWLAAGGNPFTEQFQEGNSDE
jgi:hypothetical protein